MTLSCPRYLSSVSRLLWRVFSVAFFGFSFLPRPRFLRRRPSLHRAVHFIVASVLLHGSYSQQEALNTANKLAVRIQLAGTGIEAKHVA